MTHKPISETSVSPGELISATTVWLAVPLCFGFSAQTFDIR